jgi:demethylmenaquinone methyltransferase/2-methoxy-6-polyprenyl-1,4-benzoquinol methylase
MTHPDPIKIKNMFSKVASGYDRANDVLSLGIHHLWRKKLVKLSGAKYGDSVLDCATGTGDLAIEFKQTVGDTGKVIATDFCADMMSTLPEKAKKRNLKIQFEVADVTDLPYENNQFDIVSISFGIRNVGNCVKAISEMHRVCKPGGRVMILEFGQMTTPVVASMYDFYSKNILPAIGGMITGQPEAYKYLQNSSAQFPSRDAFLKIMNQSAFFQNTKWDGLSLGIAYIYQGIK